MHIEADLLEAATRASRNSRQWAFTLSNAGSSYFQDRCDLAQLDEIDWKAVGASDWRDLKPNFHSKVLGLPRSCQGHAKSVSPLGQVTWILITAASHGRSDEDFAHEKHAPSD